MMLMTAHYSRLPLPADCSIRVIQNNINATIYICIYYNYSTVVLTIYDLSCIKCITFISRHILDEM